MNRRNILTFLVSSVFAGQLIASVDIDMQNATKIELSNKSIDIKKEGTYLISGKLDKGNITINVKDKEEVKLLLNGVDIKSLDSAAIVVENAKKTQIISLKDSVNNISDSFENKSEAVIFSKDDLEILGEGLLQIRAYKKDGIKSNDSLLISSNLDIKSNDDGIVSRDYLEIKNGKINIVAQGDGIKTINEDKGEILIKNGEFKLESEHDGIQSISNLIIEDGIFDIKSLTTDFISKEESDSSKALKARNSIKLNGGKFDIKSSDDGIHSNNIIEINGGTYKISSIDDGIHSNNSLTINSGEIDIIDSYEGVESNTIKINGGIVKIKSKDDALNAAGNSNPILYINGGKIEIDSIGDGIDVNGDIVMSDGEVIVHGPVERRNGAIDYDNKFKITGGMFVAVGSAGMAQTASENSSQYAVLIDLNPGVTKDSLIEIKIQEGKELLSFKAIKEAGSIAFSSKELTNNTTYEIYINGKLLKTFTTTGIITSDVPQRKHGKGKGGGWKFW